MHEEAAEAAREAWCSDEGPPRRDLLPAIAKLHGRARALAQQAMRNDADAVAPALALCAEAIDLFTKNGEPGAAAVITSKAALLGDSHNEGVYPRCKLAYEAADEVGSQLSDLRYRIDAAIEREAERLSREA